MAKIIKIDKKKAKRISHEECGALIEYYPSDVKKDYYTSQIGNFTVGNPYRYLECPNCKKKIHLDE